MKLFCVFTHQRRQVELRVVQVHAPGVQFGQIQQVVDVFEQGGGVALYHAELAPLRVRQVAARAQQLFGRTQDQGQWCAQFVADVGEEVGFLLVQLADAGEQAFEFGVLARDLVLGALLRGDVAALGQKEHHVPIVVPHRQQREVHHNGFVSRRLAKDLQVAADELAAPSAANEVARQFGDFARHLEPACLPERFATDVGQVHARAFKRCAVDLQCAPLGIQQTDELVHRVQHNARELFALSLRRVRLVERHRPTWYRGDSANRGLMGGM
ncbi:hypothetical protein Y695_03382 [Hydrogenophaga sp. T4]|nr:hypothetical protein Y695_03382 [Hydrogenophaga sp. T4]